MKFFHQIVPIVILALFLGNPILSAQVDHLSREERIQKRIEELQALKEKDPEAFFKTIRERKEHLRQQLQELRQKDPERFQQFLEKRREVRKKRLEYFKQHHPAAFRQFVDHRRERMERPRFQRRYERYRERRQNRR